jgi:hypothetical protein
MLSFRYNMTGRWWKGNCHIHSPYSDGGKTFAELAQMYAAQGYEFLFHTDHWVASDVESDPAQYPLLFLDGLELDGRDWGGNEYHVLCLGSFKDIRREMGIVGAMEAVRQQGGLRILAHPAWMANTIEDALRYGFDGVEVYNNVCRWLNGKGEAGIYWQHMLRRAPNTLGLAVDDAHIRPEHPTWNGGWIMAQAAECTRPAIMEAIRAGRFYSSTGPAFHEIKADGRRIHATTSPILYAHLVGPSHSGRQLGSFDGKLMNELTVEIPAEWNYAYLEIEDAQGRRAWTNCLLV